MTVAELLKEEPALLAEQIVTTHAEGSAWLDAFTDALARHRAGHELSRILSAWGLSASAAARVFGVSRQAVSKWLAKGVPEERLEMVSKLSAATDLLVRYLKRERIPAVVRRPAAALDGVSLLKLVQQGRPQAVLEASRAMFDFGRAHP